MFLLPPDCSSSWFSTGFVYCFKEMIAPMEQTLWNYDAVF